VLVRPGESIQAAVDGARPGDRILLQPGTYEQAVTINKPRITLMASEIPAEPTSGPTVILQNPGGIATGITVTEQGDGVGIAGLIIRNFSENGVFLTGVDGFSLSAITVQDNGEYGLFPVLSSNGVITGCVASGHNDTGIYVGQSENVTVQQSTATLNLNGIEIENSSRIRVSGNESFGNTAGILVVLLPGLQIKSSTDILLDDNSVQENNLPNPAETGFEAVVPSGSGILIVGTDATTVQQNRVTGNQFVGIGVTSTTLLGQLAGRTVVDIDPFPDHLRVLDNVVTGNGGTQPIPVLPPGVDLLWDGTGGDDCWGRNAFGTSLNLNLPDGSTNTLLPACSEGTS
jgi:parallel beta-helix repeat protein